MRTKDEREANVRMAPTQDALYRIERGLLEIPDGADVKAFILSGGKAAEKPAVPVAPAPPPKEKPATIGDVFPTYFKTLTKDAKATSSLSTEHVHARHFERLFGAGRRFEELTIAVVQRYIDQRAKEGVVRATITKELGTLRYVWGWAFKRKHAATPVLWKMNDLTLPKGRQKPPFQTWDQITRRIARGDLTDAQQGELWEALWCDQAQTLACLAWVEEHAPEPFIYPMFAFAAFTGARRSEIARSERGDWDFTAGMVRIRQKKADRSKAFTTRDVPIHPALAVVIQRWFAETPRDVYTIECEGEPLPIVQATKWFRRTVDGGPWAVMRGWHVFRHSLASNMAAAGVDQRVIDTTLGHSTEAMARRYRHLAPSTQTDAIRRLFGAS